MDSSATAIIETTRLRLVPFGPPHLEKLIEGPAAFQRAFGMRVVDGYMEMPEALEFSLRTIRSHTDDEWACAWWCPRGFVHKVDGAMASALVGMGGYKGPPNVEEGWVEVGYAIAPAYRQRGLACEATMGLVGHAFGFPGIKVVRAHTLPEANPSTRVLEKCGFTKIGEVNDPEDGLIWRWERGR